MKQTYYPLLSVVVVTVGDTIDARCDTKQLATTLDALANQKGSPELEIIVPYHSQIEGIENLKERFPWIKFLLIADLKFFKAEGKSREHHDELRAHGASAARGEIVAFLEDHVCPKPEWCEEVCEAHRMNYAAIGGAIENGIDSAINWANYFCDLGKYQNPVPGGASDFVSLVNASYKRKALDSVRYIWHERFNETVVNQALKAQGEILALSTNIIVTQHRTDLSLQTALHEFFIWGRSFATTRSKFISSARRFVYALLSPALPIVLMLRMFGRVVARGHIGKFFKAFPFIFLLTCSWAFGEFFGYVSTPKNVTKRLEYRLQSGSSNE